jgi:hypothetical protein
MGRYALIVIETGVVNNVIVYDGVSPFNPGTGMELREAGTNAEVGGTWNGSEFVRAPIVLPTRTQILMGEVKNPVASLDADGDPVNKTADVVAAEKLELKNLLTAALVGGADLGQVETQTLLRLERE